jgi:hypothetical protein
LKTQNNEAMKRHNVVIMAAGYFSKLTGSTSGAKMTLRKENEDASCRM